MKSDLQELHRAIASAIEGMSLEHMTRHPDGKWSVAEILGHLSLSYGGTTKAFERCLQAGRPLATIPSFKSRLAVLIVTNFGYLPEGRKAPSHTEPRGVPAETVRSAIREQILAMDEVIAKCEEQFGKKTRVLDHPILGPLTARQWRRFHLVHGKHHLKQIRRLRESNPS